VLKQPRQRVETNQIRNATMKTTKMMTVVMVMMVIGCKHPGIALTSLSQSASATSA
jgi:hypothetical protein